MRKPFLLSIIILLVLAACSVPPNQPVAPQSDNRSASFDTRATAPADMNLYRVEGKVVADADELVRQVSPAMGGVSGYSMDGYGSVSGYYRGPVIDGKSFIRVKVSSISPQPDFPVVGLVAIMKFTDTKAQALLVGDVIQAKCRVQYEAVAAVLQYEQFDAEKYSTWEFDYCRLFVPVIGVQPTPQSEK